MLGLDLDGCLYPWHVAVYDWCIRNNLTGADFHSFWTDFWWTTSELFKDNLVKDATLYEVFPPTKELMDMLNRLAEKHEFIYITGRPQEVERVTCRFLAKYNFPYFNNTVFTKDKNAAVASNNVTVYVEDRQELALSLSRLCKVFLVTQPYNEQFVEHKNITRINNILDLERYL